MPGKHTLLAEVINVTTNQLQLQLSVSLLKPLAMPIITRPSNRMLH